MYRTTSSRWRAPRVSDCNSDLRRRVPSSSAWRASLHQSGVALSAIAVSNRFASPPPTRASRVRRAEKAGRGSLQQRRAVKL